MLKALSNYDEKTIAGILARTALSLTNINENVDNLYIENEKEIRNSLINEICTKYNITEEDNNIKEELLNYIDLELSMISKNKQINEVVDGLSKNAGLPSDLYEIVVVENIKDFYKEYFSIEYKNISLTIRDPDSEYHFGEEESNSTPTNISFFMKKFHEEYHFNDYNLLVIGYRDGIKFFVHEVLRIYYDLDILEDYQSLVKYVHSFAQRFGAVMELRGEYNKFFFSKIVESEREIKIDMKQKNLVRNKNKETEVMINDIFHITKKDRKQLSMIFAIDLVKYENYLAEHKVYLKRIST